MAIFNPESLRLDPSVNNTISQSHGSPEDAAIRELHEAKARSERVHNQDGMLNKIYSQSHEGIRHQS